MTQRHRIGYGDFVDFIGCLIVVDRTSRRRSAFGRRKPSRPWVDGFSDQSPQPFGGSDRAADGSVCRGRGAGIRGTASGSSRSRDRPPRPFDDEPDAHPCRPVWVLEPAQLEAAVNEADKLDLVDPGPSRVKRRSAARLNPAPHDAGPEQIDLPLYRFRARAKSFLRMTACGRVFLLPETSAERGGLRRRLLLARARAGRGDRRPALPPHAGPAGAGSPPTISCTPPPDSRPLRFTHAQVRLIRRESTRHC